MPYPLSRRHFLAATAALYAGRSIVPAWAPAWAGDDPLPATAQLNGWLESRYEFWLARSPMQQAYLGLKANADAWDDISDARRRDDDDKVRQEQADLSDGFATTALSPDGALSYRLYIDRCQRLADQFTWRDHVYAVGPVNGWQQEIPSFLINVHRVDEAADAESYIARLRGIGPLVDQVIAVQHQAEAAGVLAPRFIYDQVLRDCRTLLAGAPFDTAPVANPLWADIGAKVDRLTAAAALKQRLKDEALKALLTVVRPAYARLMTVCEDQKQRAGSDDGVWAHPDGEAYYAHCLATHTTTAMDAAAIHDFGLAEVERLHGEMQGLMKKAGFSGDLTAFFAFLKTDPQFYFPQTAEGKAAYLARAETVLAAMQGRLGEVVGRIPRARLLVKPVEAFREQSATAAFYQSPGAGGARPGTYYVNTHDMRALPKYELEAVAYHEGLPGHHLQVSLAQEMDGLPRFRRFASFTAYAEGWALYCERLAQEMGAYSDTYADVGRLSSELWRACRLVVDTGIHMADKRWTRRQAIDYLTANTPNAPGDIVNSVERYIADPGQATAYTIGMSRILSLREGAKVRLADKFDLRAFHDMVLDGGAMPLTVLADVTEAWVRDSV